MQHLEINEVSPRDGLQIESTFISTEDKINLIDSISLTGVSRIEVTSFTSPKAIPNLRDAAEVVRGIKRHRDVAITVLVPNVKGAERALACEVDELNLVMSASESHSIANLRMSREKSLAEFSRIVDLTQGEKTFVNGSLSTSFGCPFEGPVKLENVLVIIEKMLNVGVNGITLCDTTGMANPKQVEILCEAAIAKFPECQFTLHFHNTRGMGLANAFSAWKAGVTRFDASLGGLGGCPYAPGATGNVCTEDLVHMFEQMGVNTGVDLEALIDISKRLPSLVGHDIPGQVVKAGKADRTYPMPCRLI